MKRPFTLSTTFSTPVRSRYSHATAELQFPALDRKQNQVPSPFTGHGRVKAFTQQLVFFLFFLNSGSAKPVFVDSCVSQFTLAKDFRDVVVSLRVPGMANLPIDCPEKKTLIHLAKPSLINKSPPTMFSWHALYYFAVRKLYADVSICNRPCTFPFPLVSFLSCTKSFGGSFSRFSL